MLTEQAKKEIKNLTPLQQESLSGIIIYICKMMKETYIPKNDIQRYLSEIDSTIKQINPMIACEMNKITESINGNMNEVFKMNSLEQIIKIKDELDRNKNFTMTTSNESMRMIAGIQSKMEQIKDEMDKVTGKESLKNDVTQAMKEYFTESFKKNTMSLKNELSTFNNVTIMNNFAELNNLHNQAIIHLDYIKQDIKNCVETSIETKKEMNGFINSMNNNSSKKGEMVEVILVEALSVALPEHEVVHNNNKRDQKGKMDITIKRTGYPDILIDSKNKKTNVTLDEVEKFKRDIKFGNKHGILVSCFSGIRDKKNFEIEKFENNCIGIYIIRNGLGTEDIIKAMNIIYSLDSHMSSFKTGFVIGEAEMLKMKELDKENELKLKELKSHIKAMSEITEKMIIGRYREIITKGQ